MVRQNKEIPQPKITYVPDAESAARAIQDKIANPNSGVWKEGAEIFPAQPTFSDFEAALKRYAKKRKIKLPRPNPTETAEQTDYLFVAKSFVEDSHKDPSDEPDDDPYSRMTDSSLKIWQAIVRETPQADQTLDVLNKDLLLFEANSLFDKRRSPDSQELLVLKIHDESELARDLEKKKSRTIIQNSFIALVNLKKTQIINNLKELEYSNLPEFIGFLNSSFIFPKKDVDPKHHWKEVNDTAKEVWGRLKCGWTSKEIQSVIGIIPKFSLREEIIEELIAALESNLMDGKISGRITQETEIFQGASNISLYALTRRILKPHKDDYSELAKNFPDLYEEFKNNQDFEGTGLPRRYLPSLAISFFEYIADNDGPDKVMGIIELSDISKNDLWGFRPSKGKNAALFMTLLALRKTRPQMKEMIDQVFADSSSLDEAYKDLILDRKPGRVWVTKDGKIRLTDGKSQIFSAFILYESKAEPEPAEPARSIEIVDFSHSQETIIEPNTSVKIPLLGEIGTVNNQSSYLLERMFSGLPEKELNRILDEDRLLEENISHTKKWTKVLQPDKQHFLYHSKLNLNDPLIKRASNLGIEAIYIKGSEVLLVLNGKITGSESLNIAIQGKIKENGELSIKGTSETFIGDPENLFLANLVLHCVNKPKMGCLYADKQIKAGVNQMISSWNRTTRKELPEICYPASTQEASIIALTIPEVKQTIFVSHVNLTAS